MLLSGEFFLRLLEKEKEIDLWVVFHAGRKQRIMIFQGELLGVNTFRYPK